MYLIVYLNAANILAATCYATAKASAEEAWAVVMLEESFFLLRCIDKSEFVRVLIYL